MNRYIIIVNAWRISSWIYSAAANCDIYYISNNIETSNRDPDINILKSTINNLIQENKQLLESNKQLKIEDSRLRFHQGSYK